MYYRLSRFSPLHNMVRRVAYAVLWRTPDQLKYGAGAMWRRHRLPYKLIRPGDTIIQIGAPWDTLRAGRSRAAHFSRFVGSAGRALIVEPESRNVEALQDFAARHAMEQMTVVPTGAWSKRTRLRFLFNPDHPASNLVEEAWNEPERDRSRYLATEIEVDSLDNIARTHGLKEVRLLSITTNGAELEILKGAINTLPSIQYVSVITDEVAPFLSEFGFRRYGHDDRGYTYVRVG